MNLEFARNLKKQGEKMKWEAKVWSNKSIFDTREEAVNYVKTILEIYDNSGINTALIKWSITAIRA